MCGLIKTGSVGFNPNSRSNQTIFAEFMWIASKHGFYSIVQKQSCMEGNRCAFHIRARIRKDLENLLRGLSFKREIVEWPDADYRYRFLASRGDLVEIMCFLSEELDYSNFKSMIGQTLDQRDKLSAYHDIWKRMSLLQK